MNPAFPLPCTETQKYSFLFNTTHVVSEDMPNFFKIMFGLQDMPYLFPKDQTRIQNTATLCGCNNNIIIALNNKKRFKKRPGCNSRYAQDQAGIKGFSGKFYISLIRIP